MFEIAFHLCNPILLVSKTFRDDGSCCEDYFSFAPYKGNTLKNVQLRLNSLDTELTFLPSNLAISR